MKAIGIMAIVLLLAGCSQMIETPGIIHGVAAFNADGPYGVEFAAYGDDLSCSWDVGDGSIVSGKTAIYQYNGPGEYDVTMTATDALGNQSILVLDVVVYANEIVCYWEEGAGTTFPDGCWACTYEDWTRVIPNAQ